MISQLVKDSEVISKKLQNLSKLTAKLQTSLALTQKHISNIIEESKSSSRSSIPCRTRLGRARLNGGGGLLVSESPIEPTTNTPESGAARPSPGSPSGSTDMQESKKSSSTTTAQTTNSRGDSSSESLMDMPSSYQSKEVLWSSTPKQSLSPQTTNQESLATQPKTLVPSTEESLNAWRLSTLGRQQLLKPISPPKSGEKAPQKKKSSAKRKLFD